MSKLTKGITIDGSSILKSITSIIDMVKYRKYAKEGYTTVLYIDSENTTIKILDGKIDDLGGLTIKGIEELKLVGKKYKLPTKKLVTNCVICKEDINPTIDIQVTDMSKLTPKLLNKYSETKLMDELKSFDVGQVIMGATLGIIVGGMLTFSMILVYNSFL